MATLQEMLDEQARITGELQRMEDDDTVTEEADGNYRDTLIARWKELDEQSKPVIARMEEIKAITRTAGNPANRETGDAGNAQRMAGSRGPEFMVRKDPLADREATQNYTMLPHSEVVSRANTLVEQHDKRHWLPGHRGEAATRSAQMPSIARHMLMYGGDEYGRGDGPGENIPGLRERPDGPWPAACRGRAVAGQRPGRVSSPVLPGPDDRDHDGRDD